MPLRVARDLKPKFASGVFHVTFFTPQLTECSINKNEPMVRRGLLYPREHPQDGRGRKSAVPKNAAPSTLSNRKERERVPW